MYDNIYQTNKHAFRDGFVVGVIATITTAIVLNKLTKERRPDPWETGRPDTDQK